MKPKNKPWPATIQTQTLVFLTSQTLALQSLGLFICASLYSQIVARDVKEKLSIP